ncbi:LysR substrate-binding domain-containing protein (plasmid) [Rhizobium sp. CB3060]|uniref:LysR substrate-binding domain-containing protein n=1 Tax=Rhizobium sp. CB3060 TaxID=3138255 RepID=UPI0021A2D0C9|nr:LysR substrate-binding domain-containing protein [Rhizobium tropici]UWU24016.1 LysR substrate-binding domain-containing protein [Rhizobium tropici]
MLIKRRYLPSLGSFATFEVAAKHLSFTLAGNELNVTQAAISQQIRGLEKSLGVTLFIRKHNSLELTFDGQRLLTAVSGGLDKICDAINDINAPSDLPMITCSGTNAAIAFWLKSLVDRFRSERPDVRFVLLASDEDDTLRNFDEVDLSLICGNERCEVGENLRYLFPDIVQPVCSPDYLERHGPFPDPLSLGQADLLDLHRKHWTSDAIGWHPVTWDDWFRANGLDVPHLSPIMISNNYPLLVNAAIKGEGIVLGWHHLVRSLLDEGALRTLFDAPLRVDRGYYLKVNRASLDKPHVQEFIDFVLTDLAASEQGHQPRGVAMGDIL